MPSRLRRSYPGAPSGGGGEIAVIKVELRDFGGFSVEETADMLHVSTRTVTRGLASGSSGAHASVTR
jgi:ECF sigma factor